MTIQLVCQHASPPPPASLPLPVPSPCSDAPQEHFVCTDCHCAFPDMVFFEKDGKPYCQDDYSKRFCEKYDWGA